jgi:hypothetical protein
MKGAVEAEPRLDIRMALGRKKPPGLVKFGDHEITPVAAAIVEHLKVCGWRFRQSSMRPGTCIRRSDGAQRNRRLAPEPGGAATGRDRDRRAPQAVPLAVRSTGGAPRSTCRAELTARPMASRNMGAV